MKKFLMFIAIIFTSCATNMDEQIICDCHNEYDLTEISKCEIFDVSSDMNIAFIGDSRTRDLFKYVSYDFKGNGLNFGVGGISSYGIIARFNNFDKYRFNSAILAIGHNDNYDFFERNMNIIFNYFKERKVKLFVSTIVWRNDMRGDVTGINDRIDRLNLVINKLQKYYNYTIIDINTLLSYNHMLDYKYCPGDGIHFNQLGYEILLKEYKKYLEVK